MKYYDIIETWCFKNGYSFKIDHIKKKYKKNFELIIHLDITLKPTRACARPLFLEFNNNDDTALLSQAVIQAKADLYELNHYIEKRC